MTPAEFTRLAKKYGYVITSEGDMHYVCPKNSPNEARWCVSGEKLASYNESTVERELAILGALETGDFNTLSDDAD